MKKGLKYILIYSITAGLVLVMIGFSSVKRSVRKISEVLVEIESKDGNYFTDKAEILSMMNAQDSDYVLGSTIGRLDLKQLELRIESHPFVKNADVYKDIKGNLMVKVEQAKPIGRILGFEGSGRYIDEEGYLLPVTARQTARVPIIELERTLDWEENITETPYGEDLLELLTFIQRDKFWNAQIAELVIEKDGEIVMLPQVTKQEIAFGMPDNYEKKFRKLKLFYKEILPNKGWNTYSSVNLKFKDQIVCN
ncbi:cell division protein FtsQ/DivIB [Marinoscillum sp. MHG1-6]|uniref:cell division protein FtsQ/DivIB n=1 Tax=Marinoscillum sp. MHG1-6 TaxID=2959627 RepID=UPI0021570971|nr:cell division protein FtsQ [Marinoscillum sp. MHG1-6]